jgi:FixJ family two-component response regulator
MSGSPGLVLIVDDDRMVRFHLERILQPAGYSIKTFVSGQELLTHPAPSVPACLLLDVNLIGGLDGPAIQEHLQNLGWLLPIIFITAHATVPMAVKALKSGALDVLTKPVDRNTLLPAVEKALAKAKELRREHLSKKEGKSRLLQLTRREQEVVSWVIAGKLNKQIASILGITERTVKAHRASVMEKLEINSVAELVRMADQMGIRTGQE